MANTGTKQEKLDKAKASNYGVDVKFIHPAEPLKPREASPIPFNKVDNSLKELAEQKKPNKYAEIAKSFASNVAANVASNSVVNALADKFQRKSVEEDQKKALQAQQAQAPSLHKLANDSGDRLHTKSDNKEVAQSIAAVAKHKGWTEIKIEGTESFRKEVWIEATARGLKVDGYVATKQDQVQADMRASELAKERKSEIVNSVQNTSAIQNSVQNTSAKQNSNVTDLQQHKQENQQTRQTVQAPTMQVAAAPKQSAYQAGKSQAQVPMPVAAQAQANKSANKSMGKSASR